MEIDAGMGGPVAAESDDLKHEKVDVIASDSATRSSKRRLYAKLSQSLGLPEKEVISWLSEFDRFMPDSERLTLGDDLSEKFEKALAIMHFATHFDKAVASRWDAVAVSPSYAGMS